MTVKNRNEYEPGPIHLVGDSKTKQSFRDDCDINLIVKRHASTGIWENINPRVPTYGDNTLAVELQEAIHLVQAADDEFMALPPELRKAVNNDPVQLLQALAEQNATRELQEQGLPIENSVTETVTPAEETETD